MKYLHSLRYSVFSLDAFTQGTSASAHALVTDSRVDSGR